MPNELIRRVPEMTKHLGKDLAFLAVVGISVIAGLLFTQNGLWMVLALAIIVGAWAVKKIFRWLD
jgi:hypothetical protein